MPSRNHAAAQTNLVAEFIKQREYRIFSELSLQLNGRPLTPDLPVYPRRPVDFRYDEVHLIEPPVLVVEILSPIQGMLAVMAKVEAYLQSGVKSCWVVNPPQRVISIYTPDGATKTYAEGVAKDPATGLTADLNAVFS